MNLDYITIFTNHNANIIDVVGLMNEIEARSG